MNDDITYPQCFIIRDKAEGEASWFVIIEHENDDLELLTYQTEYLNSKYIVEVTSLAEAETYSTFGIAPMGSCSEFHEWIDNNILNDVKKVGNLATGTRYLSNDDTYPSYYLVLSKTKSTPICVFPIKSKEQNIEMPQEWWERFYEIAFIKELTYSMFENNIAMDRVPEYNTEELLARIKELTKKGA